MQRLAHEEGQFVVDGFLLVTSSVPHAQRLIYQCRFSVVQEGLGWKAI